MKRKEFNIGCGKHTLELGRKTLIMGVLNVTPDSFSDGGHYFTREQAIKQAINLMADGADIIDIGGESTRPYAEKVSLEQEMERVIPVIEELSQVVNIPISIDTYKAKVAESAVKAGASIINDISALRFDPEMANVAKAAKVPIILMHMKGTPGNMQDNPVYVDLMGEIIVFFREAVNGAIKKGIPENSIILDPGIGFGKSSDHNFMIIRDLTRLKELGLPVLLGSSRKAFIGKILDKTPEERDTGTMATVAAGVMNGANIVRVHNVRMAKETVKIVDSILAGTAVL